MANNLEGVQAI